MEQNHQNNPERIPGRISDYLNSHDETVFLLNADGIVIDVSDAVTRMFNQPKEAWIGKPYHTLNGFGNLFFKKILDELPTEVVVIGPDGRYLYCNPAAVSNPETRNWMKGKSDPEYFSYLNRKPEELELRLKRVETTARTLKKQTWEESVKTSLGRTKTYMRSLNPVTDNQEKLLFQIGSGSDITDLRIAREALKESEHMYKLLTDNSMDIVCQHDLKGYYTYVSPSIETLGYKQTDLLGHNAFDFIHPDDRKTVQRITSGGVRDSRQQISLAEYRFRSSDGVYRWFQSLGKALLDKAGNPFAMITSSREITERKAYISALKAAKEQAEQADKAKSEFLANMSHEFRTPLNGILGYAELLESELQNPQHRQYLENIRSGGHNLLKLINDILDLSKIESGRTELLFEAVNVPLLLKEIGSIFRLDFQKKNIGFKIVIDPRLPDVLLLDEIRIRQILVNLIGNAIKFTDEGQVTVKVRPGKNSTDGMHTDLYIDVKDTGIGIHESQQAIIFDSFRQQSGQNNRKYGGTGLGLTITKRLTERMGGTIRVISKPGKGSRFSIRLKNVGIAHVSDDITVTPESAPKSHTPNSRPSLDEKPAQLPIAGGQIPGNDQNIHSRELIEQLNHLLSNEWEDLRHTLIMRNAREFANRLSVIGETCSNAATSQYAAELLDLIDAYDVENLTVAIEDFQKFYIKIKQNTPL